MKFTVSVKPLKNVTSQGIIPANISNFYQRSTVLQITATQDTLKLNVEASSIKTRMTLRGSGDEETPRSVMVDCLKFKKLIDSIDSDVLTLEFIPGGLYVHSGRSKFAIAQVMDTNDATLNEPDDSLVSESEVTINSEAWKFVKEHQMYAISNSEKRPVYKNVWVGENKEIIIGDMDLSLFTFSRYGEFESSCLLPPTLVNLFISIPEGSTISKCGRDYLLRIETDSYSMLTQFTPKYEDDAAVGSYSSQIILGTLNHPDKFVTVDTSAILKFINQTAIVNQADTGKITEFTIADGVLTLTNRSSSCSMEVGVSDISYTVKFATVFLKNVLSNLDGDKVNIAPVIRNIPDSTGAPVPTPVGCIFWTDNLTTMLAGQG